MLFSPSELVGFSSLIWDQRHKSRSDVMDSLLCVLSRVKRSYENTLYPTQIMFRCSGMFRPGQKKLFFSLAVKPLMEPHRCPQLQGCWCHRQDGGDLSETACRDVVAQSWDGWLFRWRSVQVGCQAVLRLRMLSVVEGLGSCWNQNKDVAQHPYWRLNELYHFLLSLCFWDLLYANHI